MLTKVFREVEHLQLKVISPCEIKSSCFKSDIQESVSTIHYENLDLTTGELWKIPASMFADLSAWMPFWVFEPKIYLHIHPIGTFSFIIIHSHAAFSSPSYLCSWVKCFCWILSAVELVESCLSFLPSLCSSVSTSRISLCILPTNHMIFSPHFRLLTGNNGFILRDKVYLLSSIFSIISCIFHSAPPQPYLLRYSLSSTCTPSLHMRLLTPLSIAE